MIVGDASRKTAWRSSETDRDNIRWTMRTLNRQTTNYLDNGDWSYLRNNPIVGQKDQVELNLHFPDCLAVDAEGKPYSSSMEYNGRTDHRDHAKYSTDYDSVRDSYCPASHPYQIIELNLEVRYELDKMRAIYGESVVNNVDNWRLSTGDASGAGGHADFVSGWPTELLENMISSCLDSTSIPGKRCYIDDFVFDNNPGAVLKTVPYRGVVVNEQIDGVATLPSFANSCNLPTAPVCLVVSELPSSPRTILGLEPSEVNGQWQWNEALQLYEKGALQMEQKSSNGQWQVNRDRNSYGWCRQSTVGKESIFECNGNWQYKNKDGARQVSVDAKFGRCGALEVEVEHACYDHYAARLRFYVNRTRVHEFERVELAGCYNDAPQWVAVPNDNSSTLLLSLDEGWIITEDDWYPRYVCYEEQLLDCVQGAWQQVSVSELSTNTTPVYVATVLPEATVVAVESSTPSKATLLSATSPTVMIAVALSIVVVAVMVIGGCCFHKRKQQKMVKQMEVVVNEEQDEEEADGLQTR